MKEETDAIMRALGDLLLQLGCDTPWLVPNTSLNTKQLNASVAQYQALLDGMELEITSATARASQTLTQDTEEPKEEVAAPLENEIVEPKEEDEPQAFNMNSMNDKFDVDLGNGLGDEIDFYDLNRNDGMSMFDDMGDNRMGSTNLQVDNGYGIIDDDQFF